MHDQPLLGPPCISGNDAYIGAIQQVRQLEELMPICSYCKKIRDDQNYWQQIEGYINERTGSEFSHSVCPDCYTRVIVPELDSMRKAAKQQRPAG